jgi:hypothetical protein
MPDSAGALTLRYAQGEVFNSRKRFRVLVAGRRFGKSYLSCVELIRGAIEKPGETFFYCAPTYRMAKDIVWKLMKKIVPKAWIKAKNETDLKLELVNGSTIELKGTENAMALRGRSLSGVVLDEAAFMDSEVWFEVIRPALADKQGWALFISTPDGTASWFYDLWCYCEEGDNDWQRWQFTTIDGDNVPPEEIEAARAQLDPRTFRQEFEASFENLSGLVAISFSDENIEKSVQDLPVLPLLIGVDFNVDPMSAVCAVKKGDVLWVFDEIIMTGGATTWDLCEEIQSRYGVERRIIACPDPTGGARKTSGVGATDHNILRKSGFTVSSPPFPLENPRQNHLCQHRPPRRLWNAPPLHPPQVQGTHQIPAHLDLRPWNGPPQQKPRRRPRFRRFGLPLPPNFQPCQTRDPRQNVLPCVVASPDPMPGHYGDKKMPKKGTKKAKPVKK